MIRKYGRLRTEKIGLSSFFRGKKESWPAFGDTYRYEHIFVKKFRKKPLLHLKKIKKTNPRVMILGAGLGRDLKLFKEDLNKLRIDPTIDVFSLTKSLSKEVKRDVVSTDFSRKKALETISPVKDRKMIGQIKGKYDLVVAPLSVGVYTDHLSYNLLLTSLMLNKNGKAYIEVEKYDMQAKERFNRFVELYNKQKKEENKFEIRIINELKNKYLEITRKN